MEYSPWSLDIETNGIIEACRELGVIIVAYSPLGRGFLTVFIIFLKMTLYYMKAQQFTNFFFREESNPLMISNRMILEDIFHVFKVKISIKIWKLYIKLMNLRKRRV
jgi:hypothetical protein